MPGKLILFVIIFCIINISTFTQNNAEEYKLPKVIEGSNLLISANPYMSSYLPNNDTAENTTNYSVDLSVNYVNWRFSKELDYSLSLFAGGSFSNESSLLLALENNASLEQQTRNFRSFFGSRINGGASVYIAGSRFFTGAYLDAYMNTHTGDKPFYSVNANPNIGFGRVVDAYVVNEASNIESILSKESYLAKKFDRKTRAGLNTLLDKRLWEYPSKYKDDADIEFFSTIEKFLLEAGVISKPLNARTTMKLYQVLHNNKFIYFPVFKGWQTIAELGYDYRNQKNDTSHYPVTLTLSGLYGLPLNNKASLLFSTAFSYPLNKNYNAGNFYFNIHAPVFLRSVRPLNDFAAPDFIFFDDGYRDIFDFKVSAQGFLFYNINPTFGIRGDIKFAAGKVKDIKHYHQRTDVDVILQYNILNKMGIQSGVHFQSTNSYKYRFFLSTRIYYYIF